MQKNLRIQFPVYIKISLTLMSIALIWVFLVQTADLLIPIAFSLVFALLLHPLCARLERWRIPRAAAIFICLIVLMTVIAGILFFIISQLTDLSGIVPDLQKKFLALFNDAQIWFREQFGVRKKAQADWIQKNAQGMTASGGQVVGSLLSTATNAFTNLGLAPVYIFFLLYYRNFLQNFLFRVFKSTSNDHIHVILVKIRDVVLNYVVGLLLVMAIIATLNTVGLLVLGIEYAFFFGVLAALLNIIPYIGIFIGSIFPILMALLTKDSLWYAVGVAGVFGTVQFLEGNFITPKIVGSKVSVNALAAVVSLILGGLLWGASGLILAIPFTAIIKVVFDNVPGLEAFGYLLGEVAAHDLKPQKTIVDDVEEEVIELAEEVKDALTGAGGK